MMRKGVFFTFDALFATLLVGIALILTSRYFISDVARPQSVYYANDIILCLSEIRVSELNDSNVKWLIQSGVITNPNNTLLEQIGEFYVLNKTEYAINLSIIASSLIPDKFKGDFIINDESLLNISAADAITLVSSKRMISGIEKLKPVRGATSKVFLEKIKKKKFSAYLYFGGFVGQGNITGFIDGIPSDVNVTDIYMELDSVSDFRLFINGVQCGDTYFSVAGKMAADAWDLDSCTDLILLGQRNYFSIDFLSGLSNSYLGGGFIRVDYYTDSFYDSELESNSFEWLPEIRGIINLYSSFYVPGELSNISVYLHYFANSTKGTNNTFYFTIGNATVFKDNNLSGEKTHKITVENISQYIPLASMTKKTVPIRAGFENVSFGIIYEGNADVAIITDVSGSMGWRMDNNNAGTARNCDDPNLNLSSTSRLSVAKCLDKKFARDILNITGNRIGLVSYSTTTIEGETVNPTTDLGIIDSTIGTAVPQTGYSANGYTCICCGINTAVDILVQNLSRILLIPRGSFWRYNDFSLKDVPPVDGNGNLWFHPNYIDAGWASGPAILGATNSESYSPAVVTEMASDLAGNIIYANLWKHWQDNPVPYNDFTSGVLNSTANTYGISGADDGWDWDTRNVSGPFGFDDDIQYNNIVSGRLEFTNNYGGSGNICSGRSCSGAYGILVNVTDEMYGMISSYGIAEISFWYEWQSRPYGWLYFAYSDQVWVKSRWTSPYSGSHYLGSNLDLGHSGFDSDSEIATQDHPGTSMSGTYSEDLAKWIEGPGMYYLEIGGKIRGSSSSNKWGTWRFDDIMLLFSNNTDHYYLRRNFTINDISQAKRGVLNILSDDKATIYINGNLVEADFESHKAEYWNMRGIHVPGSYLHEGENVIAVELMNSQGAAKFDLEFAIINDSRNLAMLVMTDGEANRQCARQGTWNAKQDAIKAACFAKENYSITVFSVGFSYEADEDTVREIALCGGGLYRKSENLTGLDEFYLNVAASVITSSRHSQSIELEGTGDIATSILFGDSYIWTDYIPEVQPPEFGEISLVIEEKNFPTCTFDVFIPPQLRVVDAKLTSYSSEHWTDGLNVNGQNIFNLSHYRPNYTALGDPFVINIPVSVLSGGNNNFFIRTGDSPENYTECSKNNTLIYTSMVKSSVSYSDILEKAVGCSWFIEFDDGGNTTVSVPKNYIGSKKCYYSNATYDRNDTYDDAMYNLLSMLDFDGDGKIFVNIEQNNLIIGAISVGMIPYPWGPAIAEMRVWR